MEGGCGNVILSCANYSSSSQLCNHQPPNTNFILSTLAMTEMCRTAGKRMVSIQWSILVMAGQVIKLNVMVN